MRPASAPSPRVVILGGGFAGLACAKALRRANVEVLLIDRQNHHLFQPLLYQVATAALAAPDIAAPIRSILKRNKNTRVWLDEALAVRRDENIVLLRHRGELHFDFLVAATGSHHSYFGHDEWEQFAPGLKNISDAMSIRRRILLAFEAAEREVDTEVRRELLTFVVVGGGPTGVELAGAIAEVACKTLIRDFRSFNPADTRVLLLEAGPQILGVYPERLSQAASRQLEELGVEVRTGATVSDVGEYGVTVNGERLAARTVLWGAGVAGSKLGQTLGAPLHRSGRVIVDATLRLEGTDNIYVAGDLAYLQTDGEAVPALAPAALQQGEHVARNILRSLGGKPALGFHYIDKGSLATIGRSRAVGVVGNFQLSGAFAWLVWLFVHLMSLVGFRNRVAVFWNWMWAYFTYQRSARLIVEQGTPALPSPQPAQPTVDPTLAEQPRPRAAS